MGSEYYQSSIIFSGEYLNGKRNGKGKEYYPHYERLCYIEENLIGVRNEKGKEFYCNGKLIFEGEHLNGKKN